ncbi:tRNA (guanine(26)-N(2))-dimethyltransferase [Lingula anatina]|uniref:tRNA (guanine(26)-N(2))-dimethyltransferase n=1 Tax=Lingula anatina TaxID=7574 RepID=A0A1S3K7H3_LINAN|nr:tRNA (guanine(26)-N(2))-dimethyltransferase [Lingula anatina]XP_013418216.1 tRNA (guanine(26)-N(2))-dimethyltransferase [Lingula anatina]|eukprot:XP_013418215.1 tRNA (guanine(26)-N(2))-dimethyltransferase [Lingula anatina]
MNDTKEGDEKVFMDNLTSVKEGKAEAFYPKAVFYNPVQEFNRDLTVAVISEFSQEYIAKKIEQAKRKGAKEASEQAVKREHTASKVETPAADISEDTETTGLKILEALSASGLRSMRFALEIPEVKEIVTNDYSEAAVEIIKHNAQHNKVQHLISPSCADAALLMYQHRSKKDRFDVVDLDPYGSPSPFLDAAVQAVTDGGLLCVTSTDTAVLCGNSPENCYAKYGSMPLRGSFCHEMALRIVLQSIQSHASRYSRYIIPLLAVSVDFYVRIFVLVYTGAQKMKRSAANMGMVYLCTGCETYSIQNLCKEIPTKGNNFKYCVATGPSVEEHCVHCGHRHHIGGPVWTAPIHDVEFVNRILKRIQGNPDALNTSQRIIGILSVISEELQDSPLHFTLDRLSTVVRTVTPSLVQLRSAILHAGYDVTFSHTCQGSLKTKAPSQVIWDIMRCWAKQNPPKDGKLTKGSAGKAILNKAPQLVANFELHPKANPKSRKEGLVRFQQNPEPNWGPKPIAKPQNDEDDVTPLEKSRRLQGKRKRRRVQEVKVIDYKKFPCKKNQEGLCTLGEDCKYSHDKDKVARQEEHMEVVQGCFSEDASK